LGPRLGTFLVAAVRIVGPTFSGGSVDAKRYIDVAAGGAWPALRERLNKGLAHGEME
jgi:hypothetical protein